MSPMDGFGPAQKGPSPSPLGASGSVEYLSHSRFSLHLLELETFCGVNGADLRGYARGSRGIGLSAWSAETKAQISFNFFIFISTLVLLSLKLPLDPWWCGLKAIASTFVWIGGTCTYSPESVLCIRPQFVRIANKQNKAEQLKDLKRIIVFEKAWSVFRVLSTLSLFTIEMIWTSDLALSFKSIGVNEG